MLSLVPFTRNALTPTGLTCLRSLSSVVCGMSCVGEITAKLVYCDTFLPVTAATMQFLLPPGEKEVQLQNIGDCQQQQQQQKPTTNKQTKQNKTKPYPKLVQRLHAQFAATSHLGNGLERVQAHCSSARLNRLMSAIRCTSGRLVGLVVKESASRAEHPGFESRLRRDFSGVESYH